MSEVGGDSNESAEVSNDTADITPCSAETEESSTLEEINTAETDAVNTGHTEAGEEAEHNNFEGTAVSSKTEISINPNETTYSMNSIIETPVSLELGKAQKSVEGYHEQSIAQILESNGKYISESDKARIANGIDSLKAIEHNSSLGRTGGYHFSSSNSAILVSAINETQLERSTKHETNHFASYNREIIVPDPKKGGYMVYNTVGTRQSSWFHSARTGENSGYTEKGRGMNEGLTTLYTNQQLTELSKEKGAAAEREQIYSHAVELCGQIEEIIGKDFLKEAYYGGNLQGLEARINELAGDKEYEHLRDCLDKTISRDYGERMAAMREAQEILAKMNERSKQE